MEDSAATLDGVDLRRNHAQRGGGVYQSDHTPGSLVLGKVFYSGNVADYVTDTNDLFVPMVDFTCPGSSCSAGTYGNCSLLENGYGCYSCVVAECVSW